MKYHLDVWLKPDLTAEQTKKELKDWEMFLEGLDAAKGSFKSESLGKRKLAYKIKAYVDGYYYRLDLESPADKIVGFSTLLNRDGSVLRYLLTRLPMQNSIRQLTDKVQN